MDVAITTLAVIGAMTAVVIIIKLANFVLQYAITSNNLSKFNGQWAVVTGASAGIGAGFVRALAQRGVNVVLLARSTDKMQTLASECESKYHTKTKIIPFDFASADAAQYSTLAAQLRPLAPKILVNNVGVNVDFPTEFLDLAEHDVDRIVNVNINSMNKMTAMLLPAMVADKKGLLFFLSSGGGAIAPGPLLGPYAGTKAYADAFAVALAGEVAQAGVVVHSLTPFFVESAMAKMRKSFTVPSADAFANSALNQTGFSTRLSPYWVHYLLQIAIMCLPHSMQISHVTKLHRSIRARALRKKARMEKKA